MSGAVSFSLVQSAAVAACNQCHSKSLRPAVGQVQGCPLFRGLRRVELHSRRSDPFSHIQQHAAGRSTITAMAGTGKVSSGHFADARLRLQLVYALSEKQAPLTAIIVTPILLPGVLQFFVGGNWKCVSGYLLRRLPASFVQCSCVPFFS